MKLPWLRSIHISNTLTTSGLKREWKVGILPVRRTVSSIHGYTFCLEESELREQCSWAIGKWWKSWLLGLRPESRKIERLQNHLDRDGYVDRKCSLSVSHIIATTEYLSLERLQISLGWCIPSLSSDAPVFTLDTMNKVATWHETQRLCMEPTAFAPLTMDVSAECTVCQHQRLMSSA